MKGNNNMKKKILTASIISAVILTACGSSEAAPTVTETTEAETTVSETTAAPAVTDSTVTSISYTLDKDKPMVALTFDDGPNTNTTPFVLKMLEKHQVPASFFLIGTNITPDTEEVVKKAYDMGCEIDNHSKTHSYMDKMEPDEIREEVQFVSDKVKEITGEPTKFFRPPYIAVDREMYDNIDMPFICGIMSNDWDSNVSVEERVEKTVSQVRDGTIILMHDASGNLKTVNAIDKIIPMLKDEGYQFVTVSELFEAKGIEINPDDNNLYTYVG